MDSTRKGIPFTLAIPAGFTSGTQSGNLTAVDGYTCRVSLSPNMDLQKSETVTLIQAAIAYTQPNIGPSAAAIPGFASGNNRISITWDGGARTDYFMGGSSSSSGLYGLSDVQLALNQIAASQNWIAAASTSPLFILTGIAATQTVILSVNPAVLTGGAFPASGVVIDFLNPGVGALNDSIGPLLGWPTSGGGATLTIPGGGTTSVSFTAPQTADMAIYTAYALWASIASNSYNQGLTGKLLAVFPLGAYSPNTIMAINPPLAFPVPCVKSQFSSIDFYFTDQSGQRLLLSNFQAPTEFSLMIN